MAVFRGFLYSVWVVLVSVCATQGQNLVPNPSFEEFKACPGGHTEQPSEFLLEHWMSVGIGTPDYFHSCSIGEGDVPYNWAGVSDPHDGSGYAGIFLWMKTPNPDLNRYREYLQCKLTQPLLRDSVYIVEFYYKLSSYSPYSIDRIGLLLSDSLIYVHHDNVLQMTPTLSVIQDSALTEQTGLWERAKMEYRARGGEQYLLIGNFFDEASTRYYKIQFKPVAQPMLAMASYYYIDDVKVIPRYLPEEVLFTQLVNEFDDKHIKPNINYVLKNIQFEFNSYSLTPDSFAELDRVSDFLKSHPHVAVQLFGHTDDQGSEPYNLLLSQKRAESVANYLVSHGFRKNQIGVHGYGKAQPLVDGTSEDARKINRRVEIRFVN